MCEHLYVDGCQCVEGNDNDYNGYGNHIHDDKKIHEFASLSPGCDFFLSGGVLNLNIRIR